MLPVRVDVIATDAKRIPGRHGRRSRARSHPAARCRRHNPDAVAFQPANVITVSRRGRSRFCHYPSCRWRGRADQRFVTHDGNCAGPLSCSLCALTECSLPVLSRKAVRVTAHLLGAISMRCVAGGGARCISVRSSDDCCKQRSHQQGFS